MAAAKPEVVIARVMLQLESQFQSKPYVFEVAEFKAITYNITLQNKFVTRQIQKCPKVKYIVHLKCTVK